MIVDIIQNSDHVNVSYINNKGQIDQINLQLPPEGYTNWIITDEHDSMKDPVFRNHDGKPVKRVSGNKFYDLNLNEFVNKRIPKEQIDLIHGYNKPNFWSVDIEVEIKDEEGFSEPSKAHMFQIYSFSITAPNLATIVLSTRDVEIDKVQTLVDDVVANFDKAKLKFLPADQKYPVTHMKFDSEIAMVEYFLHKVNSVFHVHGGWNFHAFDWEFITNRCKHLGIDMAKLCSPVGRLDHHGHPTHRMVIDYMQLYSKYSRKGYMISSALDYVTYIELGAGKLKYDGTLKQLYERDYDMFIAYAAIDTILVQLIHQKCNSIDPLLNLAYYNHLSVKKADGPIAQTDALIFEEFYENKQVYADPPKESVKEKFPGAFVKEPVRNTCLFSTGYDAKSLYPSTKRTFNLSPELYMGKCRPEQVDGLRLKGFVVTERFSVYDQSKGPGMFKRLQTKLAEERKRFKDVELDIWENFTVMLEKEAERRGLKLKEDK